MNKKGIRNKELGIRTFKVLIIATVLSFVAVACNNKVPEVLFGRGTVTIAGHVLNVQVAQTAKAQEKGLGGRDSLAENDGMLFVFPTPGRTAFWMKDTLIPLDFIWIRDGKVVEITTNVPVELNVPDAALHKYLPSESIDSALEVNAGWAARNNIKVGDSVAVAIKTK